jgi:branched-chain amino acid aminotransferase
LGSLAKANAPVSSTRLAPAFAQRWQRQYSIHADHAAHQGLEIEPSKLSITKTTTPKALEKNEDLIFGHSFTGTIPTLTYIASIADVGHKQITCSP